jgi:hypothetical protein
MAKQLTAPQRDPVSEGSIRSPAIDFTGQLDDDELLVETPSIPTVDDKGYSGDLTITGVQVNVVEIKVLNKTLLPGQAVQCVVSGFLEETGNYILEATCWTDKGNKLIGRIIMPVEA